MGQFILLILAVFGICLGVSLLIASHLSEDKEKQYSSSTLAYFLW